jgi:Spy/CpxP family protein refolding chaperone
MSKADRGFALLYTGHTSPHAAPPTMAPSLVHPASGANLQETDAMEDRNVDVVSNARPKRRFLAGLLTGGLAGVLLAGGAGFVAYAHDGPGARCMGRHGNMGPEAMRNRVEFATEWMLTKVKATDQQKVKVKEIVGGAVTDLSGLREAHHGNREALLATLTADSVDRAKLETLRKAELELAERASQRITLALADVADVLTPEQRRGLAGLARSFGGPMGFGPGGPRAPGERPSRS